MRAVVFDFDGVLVDSEPLHFRALHAALTEAGIVIDEQEYGARYLAYDDWGSVRRALEDHGRSAPRERVAALAARKAGLFESFLPEIPFFPGALELVRGLAAEMPLAIASGALRGEIEAVLARRGLQQAFAAVVGADDCNSTKPHPEPYLRALEGLRGLVPDLQADECVVIEDSLPGIAAGLAAGMKVLGVAHTYPPQKIGAAHRVVESLAAVTPATLRALFAAPEEGR